MMEEKERKKEREHKGRYAYLNDFQLNGQGEYEYVGKIHVCSMEENEKRKCLKETGLMFGIMLMVILLSGVLPFKAMRGTFYVIVPFFFECLFAFLLIPCFYTIFTKQTLRDYEYKKSYARILPFCNVIMINAGLGLIGSLLFCFRNGFAPLWISLTYILCKAISLLLIRQIGKRQILLTYQLIDEKLS